MNRIFTLMAVALTISLSSCMKSKSFEMTPQMAGLNIYYQVNGTNAIAMDPIDVAMRLNILLHDAQTQQTDLDNTIVMKESKEINVKQALFGDAKITHNSEEKSYTITYPEGYYLPTDLVRRRGAMIFHTSGKTLYEDGSSWSIYMATDSDKPFQYSSYGNTYYGNSTYYLTGGSTGSISASGAFGGYVQENGLADWTLNDLTINFGEARGYLSVLEASKIEVAFDADGTIINDNIMNTSSMSTGYASPLTYKPSCRVENGGLIILAGEIETRCPVFKLNNPEHYPSDLSKITFKSVEGSCNSTATISYNGQ